MARPHMSLQKMAVIPEACVNQCPPQPHFSRGWNCPLPHVNKVGFASPFQPLTQHSRLRAAKSFNGEFLSEYNQTSQRCSPGLAKGEREDERDEQEKGACREGDGDVTHSVLNDIRQIKSSSHLFYFSQVFLSKMKIRCFSSSSFPPKQMVTNTYLT